jgi:hypothetical protein
VGAAEGAAEGGEAGGQSSATRRAYAALRSSPGLRGLDSPAAPSAHYWHPEPGAAIGWARRAPPWDSQPPRENVSPRSVPANRALRPREYRPRGAAASREPPIYLLIDLFGSRRAPDAPPARGGWDRDRGLHRGPRHRLAPLPCNFGPLHLGTRVPRSSYHVDRIT